MFIVRWGEPYRVSINGIKQWRREWCIPKEYLKDFFLFWNSNKYKMFECGFSITKSQATNKWYLLETKNNINLFKSFNVSNTNNTNTYVDINDGFVLPDYNVTNIDGLRVWQVNAVSKLVSSLNCWGGAVDGSEMGCGKTFTACGVIRELNAPFVVVCPKPVKNQWKKVITNHFNLEDKLKGIINYELLIRGRKDSKIASYVLSRSTKRNQFTWKIPKNSVIIWDEAHRLKNFSTRSSKVCVESLKQGYKSIFLSGTLATSPLEIRTIGMYTKLFKNAKEYRTFIENHGCYLGNWGMEFNDDPEVLKLLHKYFFEQRGVRLRRDLIKNFPETEIIVQAYDMDEESTVKINEVYNEMEKELKVIENKRKSDGNNELTIRIRALQKTEMLKIPLIEEMIREGNDSGMSIVVFLNFSESIDALAKRLNTQCIYDGRNVNIREKNIELFQSNKEKNLITNISAAREGLNLQDEDGNYPRMTILSPTYSVRYLQQALGRVHRENSKTKSIQKIVYVANTQEEKVVDSVGKKMENLTLVNNGAITDDDLKI